MAGFRGIASASGVSSGTSLKTILQLKAPANQRTKVKRFCIGFHGLSNTQEPILVTLTRQSTAGTMTAVTPVPLDDVGGLSETLQTTAAKSASAEPTAGNIVWQETVHPQTAIDIPVDVLIKAGGYLGLVVTSANSLNCDAMMEFEE